MRKSLRRQCFCINRPLLASLVAILFADDTPTCPIGQAGGEDGSCQAAPSDGLQDGAGCRPITGSEASWLLSSPGKRANISALPSTAKPFVCYDGRASGALEPEAYKLFAKPSFADSGLLLVENFLSEVEVAHIGALADRHTRASQQPGYRFVYAGGRQYTEIPDQSEGWLRDWFGGLLPSWLLDIFSAEDPGRMRVVPLADDPVVSAIEDRIASMLGIPLSMEESYLTFSSEVPVVSGTPGTEDIPNFHHDKNHGLIRHATALLYLSTPEEGGETIFPGFPFHPDGPVPRSQAQVQNLVEMGKIVTTKVKGLKPGGDWPDIQVSPRTKLWHRLAALCPAEAKSSGSNTAEANATRVLAVRPKAGRAVFFWHETVDTDEVLLDVFHAGCPVRRGVKIASQKFKNFASHHSSCQRSKLCRTM